LYRIDTKTLLNILSFANPYYVLLTFLLVILGIVIRAYKWQILLVAQGVNIPLFRLVPFYFIGTFFSSFLPTNIGGDVMRIYITSKYSKKGVESLSSVFMERITGLFALVIVAFMALAFGYRMGIDKNTASIIILLLICCLCFLVVLFNRSTLSKVSRLFDLLGKSQLREHVRHICESIDIYKKNKSILLKSVTMSFIFQGVSVLSIYMVSLSLGLDISPLYFFLFVPIIHIVTMAPISLNGIGVREGAFIFFFTKTGASYPEAFSMSILTYAIVLATRLIGGIFYAARK